MHRQVEQMAETKSTEKKTDTAQREQAKIESVKRADAAVKSMNDFTAPEELYEELIKVSGNIIPPRIFP